jgi:hypothetical protein
VGVAVAGRLAPVYDRTGGSMSDLWEDEGVGGTEPTEDDGDDEWDEGDDELGAGLEDGLDETDDDEDWDEGEDE